MLLETTAVCAALAAKDELMMLNAVERLMARVPDSRSRLQVVEDVENVRPGLEDLGIGLVGALSLDHVRELGRDIDRRAFQRTGLDRAETGIARRSDEYRTRGGVCRISVAIDGAEIVGALHIRERITFGMLIWSADSARATRNTVPSA